ncbi:MAG: hypothetical protein IID44_29960, partial [Planctomycetes bacterium]|nr:hypothetical protein [Planctomycetota bacterium]
VNWFEHEPDHDDLSDEDPIIARAAVSILRLLGLFNRPADAGCLNALRAEPAIPGLTEPLFALKDREELWQQAVIRLRHAHLLADADTSNPQSAIANQQSLDAHPHVREYFSEQLVKRDPAAAREAHRRLYEHLKQSAPELPENLNDMMPLYHAVAHGCKAGMQSDACTNVYFERILRGQECFASKKLGAMGLNLSALSGFYQQTWSRVLSALTAVDEANITGETSFYLRALGRLGEARGPMSLGLKQREKLQRWKHAAISASNLSELSLTLGDVSSAVRQGEQSVELSDRSGDAFQRMGKRTTLAAALHASGRMKDEGGRMNEGEDSSFILPPSSVAHEAFREAEAMQQKRQPQYPLLWAFHGFRYSDLLLAPVDIQLYATQLEGMRRKECLDTLQAIRERAEKSRRWADHAYQDDILNAALDHLTLGRTYLLESRESIVQSPETEEGLALDSGLSALDSAEQHLSESVSLLRQAGTQDWLPLGLLHRATLWRAILIRNSEFGIRNEDDNAALERAERDLAEVKLIAERGSMLVWQIEAALERTRLALALGDRDEAGRKLDETKALVKQTEKPYEPHVPDWEDWQPPAYVGVFKEGEIVGYHRRNDEIAALQAAIG